MTFRCTVNSRMVSPLTHTGKLDGALLHAPSPKQTSPCGGALLRNVTRRDVFQFAVRVGSLHFWAPRLSHLSCRWLDTMGARFSSRSRTGDSEVWMTFDYRCCRSNFIGSCLDRQRSGEAEATPISSGYRIRTHISSVRSCRPSHWTKPECAKLQSEFTFV